MGAGHRVGDGPAVRGAGRPVAPVRCGIQGTPRGAARGAGVLPRPVGRAAGQSVRGLHGRAERAGRARREEAGGGARGRSAVGRPVLPAGAAVRRAAGGGRAGGARVHLARGARRAGSAAQPAVRRGHRAVAERVRPVAAAGGRGDGAHGGGGPGEDQWRQSAGPAGGRPLPHPGAGARRGADAESAVAGAASGACLVGADQRASRGHPAGPDRTGRAPVDRAGRAVRGARGARPVAVGPVPGRGGRPGDVDR